MTKHKVFQFNDDKFDDKSVVANIDMKGFLAVINIRQSEQPNEIIGNVVFWNSI